MTQEEKDKIKLTQMADAGSFEVIKRELLRMEYEFFLSLKACKDKDDTYNKLTIIKALDMIIARLEGYKTKTKEEKKKDYENLIEWFKMYFKN